MSERLPELKIEKSTKNFLISYSRIPFAPVLPHYPLSLYVR